jgi:hypothetical protein
MILCPVDPQGYALTTLIKINILIKIIDLLIFEIILNLLPSIISFYNCDVQITIESETKQFFYLYKFSDSFDVFGPDKILLF